MSRVFMLLLAAFLGLSPAQAAPRRDKAHEALQAQLRAHISELSSDAYEGRQPGTNGEIRTLRYIGEQLFDIGLQSGTNDPGNAWFAPVTIISREPSGGRAAFQHMGHRLTIPADSVLTFTSGRRSLIENAPMLFVGKGEALPGSADIAGRAVLLLEAGNESSGRQNAMLAAGAAAVVTVLDGQRTLENVAAQRVRPAYALSDEALGGDLEAFIAADRLDPLLRQSGTSMADLAALAANPDFVSRPIDLSVTFEATTIETRINSHNVIAKLPGRRPDLGAVLLMAHWDHFGICGEAPAEDLICNGAIDNASGLAVLIEAARRIAKAGPVDRDIYFVATTGEEMGLLGAQAFAENPPVPLDSFVAAFNIDSVALQPAGKPFAIVGKGMTRLDPVILAAAKADNRRIVADNLANAFVRRQDGWELLQHDVPAVMVSSSWSDIKVVEAFMESDYHRVSDQLTGRTIELGGAADDVMFLTTLARWFADPRKVPATTP